MAQAVIDMTVEEAVVTARKNIETKEVACETRMTKDEALWLFNEANKDIRQSFIIDSFKARFNKTVSQPTVARYRAMKVFSLE